MDGSAAKLLFTEELRTQQLPAGKNDKAASKVLELLLGAGSKCPQLLEKNLMLKWFMSPPHPKTAALQAIGSVPVCFASA